MLRSNSDSSLIVRNHHQAGLCNMRTDNQIKGCMVNVSTQTEYGLNGLESLLIPSTIGFPYWNSDQLPLPPPPLLPPPPPSSSANATTTVISSPDSQHQQSAAISLKGINQVLLAHALGQLAVDDEDDEEEEDLDDDDDYEDDEDDVLQECDAIEYEDVFLTRQSPNQSLGLCLSSDPPQSSITFGQFTDSNHQQNFNKRTNSQGNSSSSSSTSSLVANLPSSASFDYNQHNDGHKTVNDGQDQDSQQQFRNNQSIDGNETNDNDHDDAKRSEAYINLLEPGGLAERSGLIQIGDQILEINGLEIYHIDEAKSILSRRDIGSFELLIGRPNVNHDHSKCRERSLAKRVALFESSETGDANHVAIVDCSQEFYILSMDSNKSKVPVIRQLTSMNSMLTNGQFEETVNRKNIGSTSSFTSGLNEVYFAIGKQDEKDSGMGKTDGDSSCSRTNDTCSTDHELKGSDRGRANESTLPGGVDVFHHGSTSYSSEGSLEGKRQALLAQKSIMKQQQRTINERSNVTESFYFEIDDNNNGQGKNGDSIGKEDLYDEECHYASTEIVPSTSNNQQAKSISIKSKPSPPEIMPKPMKKLFPDGAGGQSKPSCDILPEMQLSEKKESIKRWIKSGLSTTQTPPSLPPLPPSSSSTITSPPSLLNNTNNSINNMSNRPSSFKPGFILRSPIDCKHFSETGESNVKTFKGHLYQQKENGKSEIIKGDKGIVTEEKGTQIESDAASLMSCESCRMCCIKSQSGQGGDKSNGRESLSHRGEYFAPCGQPLPINRPQGSMENKRTGNLPIPVKVPVVPDISANVNSINSNNNQMSKSSSRSHLRDEKENVYNTIHPITTMYTTKANLEHTIKLQQEILRQALIQQQKMKSWTKRMRVPDESTVNNGNGNSLNQHRLSTSSGQMGTRESIINSPSAQQISPSKHFRHFSGMVNSSSLHKVKEKVANSNHFVMGNEKNVPRDLDTVKVRNSKDQVKSANSFNVNVNMEWKIKKRPDGTRYITRKPIRAKILKERAEIINQERSDLTTDDDTMSELKVGRYWSRDERKKHSEKAKDRKRREMLLRAIKMSSVREHSEEREPNKDHPTNGGNHSSSGSSGSMTKARMNIGTIKGYNLTQYNGHNIVPMMDKNIQGLIKHSASSSNQPTTGIVKINGPMHRVSSKNQINELLTVTTV